MERFRKLLFVALMLTVLVGSEAMASPLSCFTENGVPPVIDSQLPATLKNIGLTCTGDATTANFALQLNTTFASTPFLSIYNGSSTGPALTVPGQLGADGKSVIWLNISLPDGTNRAVIDDFPVNVKSLSDVSPPNTAVTGYLFDSFTGSPIYKSSLINFAVPVLDPTICASVVPNIPGKLSLLFRFIPVGGKFYNALLDSPDGSNKFYVTAAEEVNPGSCTDAAKVTTEQNGAKIDINDILYQGKPYSVGISYAASDKSFAVTSATLTPKAALSVSPLSFTITHSWSAPYSTSCPQLIGTLHIMNTGEAGSDLYYSVSLGLLTETPDNNEGFIVGSGVSTPTEDVRLNFNCNVSGPGTYTDTIVIKARDRIWNSDFPNQTVTVTIVVTP